MKEGFKTIIKFSFGLEREVLTLLVHILNSNILYHEKSHSVNNLCEFSVLE